MNRIYSDDLLIISRFRRLRPWWKPAKYKRKYYQTKSDNVWEDFPPLKKEKHLVASIPSYKNKKKVGTATKILI